MINFQQGIFASGVIGRRIAHSRLDRFVNAAKIPRRSMVNAYDPAKVKIEDANPDLDEAAPDAKRYDLY